MQRAVNVGAVIKTAVSRKTDFLVVGRQYDGPGGAATVSNKEEKARAILAEGKSHLRLLSESEFLRLLQGTVRQPDGTLAGTDRCAPDRLRVDAVRRGEVPGIHTVTYDSAADSIVLTHDAHNRRGFALGAVLAAEFTATHSGLLSTDDLFNF